MSGDLIDSVESLLQSRLGAKAAEALGVPAPATRNALRTIALTVMAGVAEQCGTVDQAEDLLMTLRGARQSDPSGADLIKLLAERAPHVGARAPTFLSQLLFGANEDSVVDAIAAASQLEPRPVSHLLEVSVIAVFSMLRDHAREESWDGARMRQSLQLERLLIKVDLDREVAKASGFDWLASDDPSAPLFAPKPLAPQAPVPPAVKHPTPAPGASPSTGPSESAPSPPPGDARPKDSASRSRKSTVDLLQARMAQGSLPNSSPASPIAQSTPPTHSIYAERRLHEWLEPANPTIPTRKSVHGPAAGATGASALAGVTTEDRVESEPSKHDAAPASPAATALEPASATAIESAVEAAPDENGAGLSAHEVYLEVRVSVDQPEAVAEDVVALDVAALDVAALDVAALDVAAPDAASPDGEPSTVADMAALRTPAGDEIDFEKTMPLPFEYQRHSANPRWPFSIFECRDPVYVDAPESYAVVLGSPPGAMQTHALQESHPTSTIAHNRGPLAQSSLTPPSGAADAAPAKRTAPAITRPALPSPTIFTDEVATDPKQNPTKSISNWWLGPVVIVAAVVALVILSYRITNQRSAPDPKGPTDATQPTPASAAPAQKTVVPTAPTGVPKTAGESKGVEPAALVAVTLPGGSQMQVRDSGFIANLARALGSPGAEPGQRFVMDEISFDRDTPMLAPNSDPQLRQLTELLTAYPQLKVRIEGHTDRDGDTAVIRALSTERAASVKATLILNGISEDRVQSQGFGADRPLSTSTSAQERAQNRRIELVIVER